MKITLILYVYDYIRDYILWKGITMKKIQTNTIYQCSFCDFQDTSPKVVGKHEWNCRNNTVVEPKEKIRRDERKLITESGSIKELNDIVLQYLNNYHPNIINNRTRASLIFSINKKYTNEYTLYCSYPSVFEGIGIGTQLTSYPNLRAKLNTYLTEVAKYETERNEFIDARTKVLNDVFYISPEYLANRTKLSELKTKQAEIAREIKSVEVDNQIMFDKFCDNFEKEYGYNPNSDVIKSLREDLGVYYVW